LANEHEHELKSILSSLKTIASVGASSNPEKPSHEVVSYLIGQGFHVIPVNPSAFEIHGEKSYPDLASIPEPVDAVQIFRRPEDVPAIVDEAIRIGAKVIWMQEGVIHEQAAALAEASGLKVVMDRCMMKWHKQLFGNLAILTGM